MWEVGQTQAFEEWWNELSEQEQDDVTAIVELLQVSRAHATAICASCAFNPMEIRT